MPSLPWIGGHPCSPLCSRQANSPSEINLTTDEVVRERVGAVLRDPTDSTLSDLPPLVTFMTWGLLRRLSNEVATYSLVERAGWCKSSALAKVVASVTGARPQFGCRRDWEYPGNRMEAEIKNRLKEFTAATTGAKKSARKAIKMGRTPPPYCRLTELLEHPFRCSYGCTPHAVKLPRPPSSTSAPILQQQVPWEVTWVSHDPVKLFSSMQQQLNEARCMPEQMPMLERQVSRAEASAGVSERAREAAEERARAAEQELKQERERSDLRAQTASARHKVETARLKEAEAQRKEATAQVHKLGSHVARAALENGKLAQEKASMKAEMGEWSKQLQEERDAWRVKEARLRELKAEACSRARAAEQLAEAAPSAWASAGTPATGGVRSARRIYDSDGNISDGEDASYHPPPQADPQASTKRSRAAAEAETLAQDRILSMPTWRAVREKGTGRGAAKLEWGTRLVIYSLLAMMVPCSAIGMAIVAVVTRTAPWLNPTAPTVETVRRCRFELRYVEEASSARRVAGAYKVRGIGFDETTKLGEGALTSNVTIEPTEGAPLEDVIMRAAYCPLGGTSEKVVSSIDLKCFARLRDMLRRWECKFHEMYPDDTWMGPDPSRLGLHQLGGGGAIQSDTCNSARCAKRLLAELVAKEVQADCGAVKWAAMSEEEKEFSTRTHQHDCWQHLRNIFLAEMSSAQAKHMQAEMQSELDTFSSWERMSTEYSQLLRSTYKEFHHGCRYYKGKGKPYDLWLRETHPKAFVVHLERADGGRQDLDYDAAIPMYIDRKYFVEYLHTVVFGSKHSNILEDFLYVSWRSLQFVAATRANGIIDILISRPLRWLTGNSRDLVDWSPFSMGEALDIVEQFLLKAQTDGSLFLDPALDLFEPIARKQPLFRKWRKFTFEEDHRLSPDGSSPHLLYKLARDELLQPKDPTNVRTRLKTIECALPTPHAPRPMCTPCGVFF